MTALLVGRGAANIVIKSWGDDGREIVPLRRVVDDKELFGDKEEKVGVKKNDKVLEQCLVKCRAAEVGSLEKRPCSDGCKKQATALEGLKVQFPKTQLQYLLGTALDKCWEGCGKYMEDLNPMHIKKGPSNRELCKIGCSSMQKLQRNSYKESDTSSEESKESSEEDGKSSEEDGKSSEEIKKPVDNKKKAPKKALEDIPIENTFLSNMIDSKKDEDEDESQFGTWHVYVIRPWSDLNTRVTENFGYMDDVRKQLMDWAMGEGEFSQPQADSFIPSLRSHSETAPQRPPTTFSSKASSALTNLKAGASTTFHDFKVGASSAFTQIRKGASRAFKDFKTEVGTTLAGNSVMSNLTWILIGSGMVVILASIFSWIYDAIFPPKIQDDGDYYKLHGGASPPALPSYEDCVKADRASLTDVEGVEEYFKVNLGYPRPMVVNLTEEKVPLEKNQEV